MPAPETYGSGVVPQLYDTERILMVKEILATRASGAVVSSAVDPTGVVTITGLGWCIGTGSFDGRYWKKTSSGTGTDWAPV